LRGCTSSERQSSWFHIHIHIFTFDREPKHCTEEQSVKCFNQCLETIKGYLNVQTFFKKFSEKLLKFNVKLAPSPLIGHFTFIFTFDREPKKNLRRRAIRKMLQPLLGNH